MMRRSIRSRMRASRIRLAALALCAAVMLGAASARGQVAVEPAAAPATFKEALAAYDAGRYAEASELFERAYRQTHVPSLLFNIAQASRLLGDCPRAVAYYRRFISEDPASPDRPRAETWVAELGSCPAPAADAHAAPGTSPATPEPAQPTASLRAPPPVSATPAAPVPDRPGLTPSEPAPLPPPGRSRAPGYALLAGSAVLGAAAGLLGMQAMNDSAQINSLFHSGGFWDDAAAAIDRQGRSDQTWSIVLVSVAAAAAVAGLAYLLATRPGRDHGH